MKSKYPSDSDATVTILMPVYNAAPFLPQAIDSILSQTLEGFKLLIINDGSTDESEEIMKSYSDNRIRIINNQENKGLIVSLNLGLGQIETKYIARADADDICLPTRLEEQVAFMEAHPTVGLCGTWFDNFDENGIRKGGRYAELDFNIKLKHLYQIHVSHGTAIIRNSTIKNHGIKYNPAFAHAEDYDFFDQIGEVSHLANLPKTLYLVRQHVNSVSKTFKSIQEENSCRVKTRIFSRIGVEVSSTEINLYRDLQHQSHLPLRDHANDVLLLLSRIHEANLDSQTFPVELFRRHLSDTWFNFCYANASRGFDARAWLGKAKFVQNEEKSVGEITKMILKGIIRK